MPVKVEMMTRAYVVGDVIRPLLVDTGLNDFVELWKWSQVWPPDAFAICHLLLQHNAIYRAAVSTEEVPDFNEDIVCSHKAGRFWPNQTAFGAYTREVGARWRSFATGRARVPNSSIDAELAEFFSAVEVELPRLLGGRHGYADASQIGLATLFCLAAAADEACVGVGLPGDAVEGAMAFDLIAGMRLVNPRYSSLSRFSSNVVRVLPKSHTPQRGMTIRSLSHHVCATTHDFGVLWHMPQEVTRSLDERLNLLLVPWPFVVTEAAVSPTPDYDTALPEGWGYFDFAPPTPLDVDAVIDLIHAAERSGRSVDGLVMPEASVTNDEADLLMQRLELEGIRFALMGIRGDRLNAARLSVNKFKYQQDKHHRWCLDYGQITRYDFQRTLNPHVSWWENIRLGPRKLGFLAISSWLTLCHVICEDLARLDPVDQLIRSVGPNLLIALLQDGPQLGHRWGARYATVYSDDPGTSVLTLTSLGMALASSPPKGGIRSRCVALWSDPQHGSKELSLDEDHEAIWISLCSKRVNEFTADGRADGGMASQLLLVDHSSVRS